MGEPGSLALGFLLASIAVQGVMKTAASIALVGPLLVLAVPILDTSFVVLKRLKYRRAPWSADQNHFYHRFMRIGLSQRRTAAYLHLWAALLSAYAILLRFAPPRPHGAGTCEHDGRARWSGCSCSPPRSDGLHAGDPQAAAPRGAAAEEAGAGGRHEEASSAPHGHRPLDGDREPQQIGRVAATRLRHASGSGFFSTTRPAGSVSIRSRPSAIRCSSTAPGLALEDRPDGRAEHRGLAVHRPARRDEQVGERNQAAAVDGLARDEHAGRPSRVDGVGLLGRARDDDRLASSACEMRSSSRGSSGSRSRPGRGRTTARCGRRRRPSPGRRRPARAPPRRARSRRGSTPPSGPGTGRASAAGAVAARRSAGIASGTSTRVASRQFTWCWAKPTRSRTSSCSVAGAAGIPPEGRSTRGRVPGQSPPARQRRSSRTRETAARALPSGRLRRGGRSLRWAAPAVEQPSCLRKRPGRHLHLVALAPRAARPAAGAPEHVRGVREVDPDPHRAIDAAADCLRGVSRGLSRASPTSGTAPLQRRPFFAGLGQPPPGCALRGQPQGCKDSVRVVVIRPRPH